MCCLLCDNEVIVRGYCRRCYEKLKRKGELEYKNHKECLVSGKGVNDMPHGWAKRNQRIYYLWRGMIDRCYSGRHMYRTYANCEVCDRWLILSNFIKDLPYIKNYSLWKDNENKRVQLDKDIIGGDMYSIETCQFIEHSENAKEGQFRNGRHKEVIRIANDGSTKIYESTIAPQHEDGFSQACVSNCCIGKQKQHKGYTWMFLKDYNNIIK